MSVDLSTKIVVVTGASRGIGQAILHDLAKQGAKIIGTATTQDGADKIQASLRAITPNGYGRVLNLADAVSIDAFFEQLKQDALMPDILINNAGITRDNLMLRMKDEEWNDVIQTNLTGVFKLMKGCLRSMMKNRWGRIISLGSVVGTMGNPGQANYCAAKAGVVGLSKSLAREVASRDITVNVVAPGFIQTDMTSGLPEEYREGLIKTIPLGRIGMPEEIAHAVRFLIEASYITGETIHVNGGMTMS
jgi:3-oxoacyl-[acyl-carrier protein] reductase